MHASHFLPMPLSHTYAYKVICMWRVDFDEHIRSRLNPCQLIAEHFGPIGLCQLHAKQFSAQLKKAYVFETSCHPLLFD